MDRKMRLYGLVASAITIILAESTPFGEDSSLTTMTPSVDIGPASNGKGNNGCPCPSGDFNRGQKQNVLIYGMSCACSIGQHAGTMRDDYYYTPGIGSHKFHTRATVWNEARKLCSEEGGHLAIVNSIAEAHVLMDIFNHSGPVKGAPYPDEAFLGIHDLYKEGEWVTVQGDSLGKTGYTRWSDKWGGQPDNGGGRQNCGAFMKEGGLDDVACDVPFPFFCELPTLKFS